MKVLFFSICCNGTVNSGQEGWGKTCSDYTGADSDLGLFCKLTGSSAQLTELFIGFWFFLDTLLVKFFANFLTQIFSCASRAG